MMLSSPLSSVLKPLSQYLFCSNKDELNGVHSLEINELDLIALGCAWAISSSPQAINPREKP